LFVIHLHKFAQNQGRVLFAHNLHIKLSCTRFAHVFLPAASRKCTVNACKHCLSVYFEGQ
jgi:hypothetical protein